MTRIRAHLQRRLSRHDEEGQALILAIVFLLVFALMLTALLSGVSVNLNMTAVAKDQSQLQYAADAGIEWGINQIKQSGTCNNPTPITGTSFFPVGTSPTGTAPFTLPAGSSSSGGQVGVSVYCQPIEGLGSGTFGGFDVVTGMNYPNVPGYPSTNASYQSQEFAGQQTCTSFSGDPVGSGKSTYATQVAGTANNPPLCLSYPSNPWSDSGFVPDDATGALLTPGNVNQIYAIGPSDVYAVGAPATASPSASGTITKSGAVFTLNSTIFSSGAHTGWNITDSANELKAGTTITSEGNGTAAVNKAPTAVAASDTFTLTKPANADGIYHFDGEDDFSYLGGSTFGTTPTTLNGVWAPQSDPTHVWVVGANGTILSCSGGCSDSTQNPTWSLQASQTTQSLNAITGLSTSALWAAGANGTLVSYNGSAWVLDSLPAQSPVSGSGQITAPGPAFTISSSLFTSAGAHVGWTISDTGGGINTGGMGTKIVTEGTGTATVMPNATKAVATDTFTLTPPAQATPTFNSIYADAVGDVWAAGSANNVGVIYECANPCSASTPSWVSVPVTNPPTSYSGITANTSNGTTSVWAVGGSKVTVCAASCGPAGTWTQSTVTGNPTLNDIIVADLSDIWAVGNGGSIYQCTSVCTTSSSVWLKETTNETEGNFNTATAVPASLRTNPSWSGSVWAAGVIPATGGNNGTGWVQYSPTSPTSNVLLNMQGGSILNGGALNPATPMNVTDGSFDQYSTSSGSCPTSPVLSGGLKITNGTWQCITSVPSALLSLDEPLPSEASGPGNFASCVAASNCADLSAAPQPVTVHPNSSGCTSFTEFFPGYYKSQPKLNTMAGATNYFASGAYYFAGNGWGALDGNVSNPAYIIGGQPGAGDLPTVDTSSPCWSYITSHGQNLDSMTSFASLGNICGTGTQACVWPSGSWYEGGGATATPNGTGVDWILGGGTWLDVHTIDMELFTRAVPDATNPAASATDLSAQIVSEGSQGLSMREIPPTCPSGAPSAGADGAVHPGPFCVTTASKWAPLNPGAMNQALQIDANNHSPYVYIHGAIYMPDNDVTLFTNQANRDVWVGALDLNSLELTYDSSSSPPIQIISGGSPKVVQVELIAQAQDPSNSVTTSWEEAVVNLPPAGSPPSTNPTIQSWRYCNGGSALGGSAPGPGDFVKACQT